MRNRKRTAETMTTEALPRKRWHGALRWTALGVALLAGGGVARAQGGPSASPVPVTLTLKRTVEMALANSRDIRAARMQASLAQQSADVAKAEFLPNLYAGSGAAYTNGIPQNPGGRAPAPLSVWYTQQLINQPLKGQWREAEQQARSQALALDEVRNLVIERTAGTYLEIVKLRHGLELLKQQEASAQKILGVTQERAGEGLELPIETTRAQLTSARIKQRVLQLEGRQQELEAYLRIQTGLQPEQPLEVSAEELPAEADARLLEKIRATATKKIAWIGRITRHAGTCCRKRRVSCFQLSRRYISPPKVW